jgi:hypothetical protein
MISLVDDLKFFRADRPSEWKMDEFINKAEKLTAERDDLQECFDTCYEELQATRVAHDRIEQERDELAIRNKRQEDIICVLMCADETGYVDGEGFVMGFNQITDEAKALLAKRDLEMQAKGLKNLLLDYDIAYAHNCIYQPKILERIEQLAKQAEGLTND